MKPNSVKQGKDLQFVEFVARNQSRFVTLWQYAISSTVSEQEFLPKSKQYAKMQTFQTSRKSLKIQAYLRNLFSIPPALIWIPTFVFTSIIHCLTICLNYQGIYVIQ